MTNKMAIFWVILLISCKSLPRQEANLPPANNTSTNTKTTYYYFKAEKNSDSILLSLQKTKVTHSKLKGIFTNRVANNQYITKNWLVSFLSDKESIQLQIKNPLIEEIEYINKKGLFEKHIIKHNNKEFVLRIPYLNSIKSITFDAIINENGKQKTKRINSIIIK